MPILVPNVMFERRCISQKTTQSQHTGHIGIICKNYFIPSMLGYMTQGVSRHCLTLITTKTKEALLLLAYTKTVEALKVRPDWLIKQISFAFHLRATHARKYCYCCRVNDL